MLNKKILDYLDQNKNLQYVILDQGLISYDPVYRKICKSNGCGHYGKCYSCPPLCGEENELIDRCRAYPKALMYSSFYTIEDSLDFEGMTDGRLAHEKYQRAIHRMLLEDRDADFLHLGTEACDLCEVCACREEQPCRHPELAQISVEACCIDVASTAKAAGMKYTNGINTVTYFGIILFRE